MESDQVFVLHMRQLEFATRETVLWVYALVATSCDIEFELALGHGADML